MSKKGILTTCILFFILNVLVSGAVGGFCGYLVGKETAPAPQKAATRPTISDVIGTGGKDTVVSLPATQTDKGAAAIAEQCTPYVVNITIYENKKGYTGGSAVSSTVLGHGTGVIVRENGYIVTCDHVVEGADKIEVVLHDDTKYEAKLVGHDARFDLAVIRVEATGLPFTPLGDSDAVRPGEQVVAIGNPLGEFGSSVSSGILSAPTRDLTIAGVPMRLMQTDAAINPGNSGGGLFNARGEMIGIVNAKISASGIEGIGFAIPWNSVAEKVESIITSGNTTEKAYLGVGTKSTVIYEDGDQINCVQVTTVNEGSPAESAGLQVGDYIIKIGSQSIKDNDALTLEMNHYKPGDVVDFEIRRDTENKVIQVTLGKK